MGETLMDHVFHRNFHQTYPLIERGRGVFLYDENGKRYLDGCAGAISVSLGYNNQQVIQAMLEQANRVPFTHTMRFETKVLHELSSAIARLAPDPLQYVYLTSGGAEAVESAIKLARQYHLLNGQPDRTVIIGRGRGTTEIPWVRCRPGAILNAEACIRKCCRRLRT